MSMYGGGLMTQKIDIQEHLIDEELHQVMEIVATALDRSSSKGFIIGDTNDFELSITAYLEEDI